MGRESTQRSKAGYGDMGVNRGEKKSKLYISDSTSLPRALCSAMSAGWDGGRDEGKAMGGPEDGRKAGAEPYSVSVEEAAVALPWVLAFYLALV